jgi:hypothetical protein
MDKSQVDPIHQLLAPHMDIVAAAAAAAVVASAAAWSHRPTNADLPRLLQLLLHLLVLLRTDHHHHACST